MVPLLNLGVTQMLLDLIIMRAALVPVGGLHKPKRDGK